MAGNRYFRWVVLGLMVFLAAAAPCSAGTYDPDPYDNAPPVVSVEFSYVVPWRLGMRSGHGAQGSGSSSPRYHRGRLTPSLSPTQANTEKTSPSIAQGSPQLFQPLRR